MTRTFEHAVDLSFDERDAWLASEAGDDPELLDTVRRMLAADAEEGGMLDDGIARAAHLVLEPETSLPPGTRVGNFDIVGELGRGGMGIVYAGRDRHLDRPVALKFIQMRPNGGRGEAERVLAEAKAASALDHPNVASIYQVGETDDGRYFIAMQRYEGETLRARLANGSLPASETLAIARQIASGLAAAHRAGIVHRDVTPGNIFLTSEGPAKLLDFGIAAPDGWTEAGTEADAGNDRTARGTISYMSPEQARGMAVDARTDVWSLGVVLFRMLTGELPFARDTGPEVLAAIRGSDPAPRLAGRPGIPNKLARVVDRSLSRDATRRYADAGEMLQALERSQPARRTAWALLALVALGLVAMAVAAALRDESGADWLARASSSRTLAILPAVSAAGDSAHVYLAVGMMDELTSRLTRLRRLRVKGPRAVTGSDVTGESVPQELGRALGVDYFVRSEFQRADSLLVMSLRLVDAREGFQVWAGEYTGTADDLLVLQDSVVRNVALAVAGELSAEERAALGARMTTSPVAYDHFLRANYLLGKRTPDSVLEADREYGIAIENDRRFAEAFAGQAYAQLLFLDWGWPYPGRTDEELRDATRVSIDRAMELDPSSALVWLARAYERVVSEPLQFSGALAAFERSLRIDSLNAEAHHQYGQTLMALGHYEEAVDAYRRALALDPVRPMTLVPMAGIALRNGRPEEARRWADSAVAVTRTVPAPYALAVRANIALRTGDAVTGREDSRRALDLDDSYPAPALSTLAMALARLGEEEAARSTLERLMGTIDRERPTSTDVRFVSSALLALGRTEAGLELIERARPRGALLWFYLRSADFDPYRSLPRFRAVEREADPRSPPERPARSSSRSRPGEASAVREPGGSAPGLLQAT